MARDHFGFRLPHATWRAITVGARPPSCFADEIAIDFPSVNRLVPRVRDQFFGQPHVRTVLVQLSVSHREAARGATVALSVPLRGTCGRCGGRGETWSDACPACDGSGDTLVQYPLRVQVPAGATSGARLRVRVNSPFAVPVMVDIRIAIDGAFT